MAIFCDDAEVEETVAVAPLSVEEALEAQRHHERFRADALYFDAHRGELLARYPGQWVAVFRETVVGVAREHRELLAHLSGSGVPVGSAYIQFAADDDVDLILAAS